MRDTYTNSNIKVHYIWFYNLYQLYIFIVKSFSEIISDLQGVSDLQKQRKR